MHPNITVILVVLSMIQGLAQVVEMVVSAVLPIMSLYKLPHGQYAYSGHVIELLVTKFGIVTSASLID